MKQLHSGGESKQAVSKITLEEAGNQSYEAYVKYYTVDCLSKMLFRSKSRFLVIVTIFTIFTVLLMITLQFSSSKAMKSLGGELHCDPEVMKPSPEIPKNVNKLRPADIKVIAAMGDSITIALRSKNFEGQSSAKVYPGNSYIIGGDGTLRDQITVGKVLREFNQNLVGLSHGIDYGNNSGFNVAVGGMTSKDLPRQAAVLIKRMEQAGVSLKEDWKIVSIFIGTNDLGNLKCRRNQDVPIGREEYKVNLIKAISVLRTSLKRTLVSIIPMWNSQILIEAQSIIFEGKRRECGEHSVEKRDALCSEYRKVAYEIQDERMFDSEDFTVVAQGFMDNVVDAFRNRDGAYDTSFYADDTFHLSKYGNAVIGKFLWNSMLEPVGSKSVHGNLGDDSIPLKCPTMDRPYIQTLNNK
ncbi:unnamed protein product [Cylicocyclus nassatus]|uniref:Uncharacterized protein n=1 Tax=Cylicocyclus nassatus TaxID=53992 RepID=A0AA36GGR1_CYLNA|nr:unnamed protein product [Cylicocyclus nassatus]